MAEHDPVEPKKPEPDFPVLDELRGPRYSLRRRLSLADELVLAVLPTATVIAVYALVGIFSSQPVLFTSLASSAFLIYLEPEHGANTVRTLVVAQVMAAGIGLATYAALGPGYVAGGTAMIGSIVAMILLDAVHPPAIGTALSFAFKVGEIEPLLIFVMAVAMTGVLVILEKVVQWLLVRRFGHDHASRRPPVT